MKSIAKICASALLFTLPVAADNALVYLSPSRPKADLPASLTPSEARLVIAERLGLSRYHSLREADERSLRAINAFGAQSQSLFTSQHADPPRHALAIIEGIVEPEDLFTDLGTTHFSLESPPSAVTNTEFLTDLRRQYTSEHGATDLLPSKAAVPDNGPVAYLNSWSANVEPSFDHKTLIYHDTQLDAIAKSDGIKSKQYRTMLADTKKQLQHILSGSRDEITLLLMPYQSTSGGLFKRSASASWGQYTKVRRDEPDLSSGRPDFIPESDEFDQIDTVGGHPAVEPESESDSEAPLAQPVPAAATFSPAEFSIQQEANTTKPVRGILPYCFKSMDICNTRTHNCSGHGECRRKYTDNAGEGGESCYSCSCSSTTEDRAGVKKTTQWAGPACQKKDVSMPFWLIGGTTIALVFAVTWGVGLLYAMGSEDLPSVIGAGVSNAGARAK